MARIVSVGTTTFLSLMLSSTALLADVTPEQVWEGWQKQYAAYGFKVAPASVSREGDTLAIRDVTFTSEFTVAPPDLPEGTPPVAPQTSVTTLQVPALLLKDLGNGSVEASVEGEILGSSENKGNGAADTAKIRIDKTSAKAVISGSPEAMVYDVDAPEVVVNVEASPAAGGTQPAVLSMTLTGLTGKQSISETAGMQINADLKASGMKMHMTGEDPEQQSTVSADIDLSDIAIKSDSTMPEGVDTSKLGEALAMGMSTNGVISYGAMAFKMDSTTKDGPVSINGTAGMGQADISFSRDAARYAVTGSDVSMEMTPPGMPMPLSAQIAKSGFDFAIPLAATPEPQPFTGKISLEGLSLSEPIWAMLDPMAKLGHGPATLIVDLTGKGRALVDLFSPAAMESKAPPVEVSSLDVNHLQLTAAGAELTGQGALTFDNSMGMPMPLGAIDLKLSGANKLMDGLVAMGLMPQDQVMFAKMMMGLYAKPVGEDEMTSKIEFKEGGKILANGQPIQ